MVDDQRAGGRHPQETEQVLDQSFGVAGGHLKLAPLPAHPLGVDRSQGMGRFHVCHRVREAGHSGIRESLAEREGDICVLEDRAVRVLGQVQQQLAAEEGECPGQREDAVGHGLVVVSHTEGHQVLDELTFLQHVTEGALLLPVVRGKHNGPGGCGQIGVGPECFDHVGQGGRVQ